MEKEQYKVGIIVGSLRKDSLSLKMANCIRNSSSSNLNLRLIAIDQLPLYNEDLETDMPPESWQLFRAQVRQVDAILFVTPEYNRSVPAVLKNAIDVGSAPHGQNVFENKPAGIISLSPGKMGAFGANHHLRQSLVFLNMPVMQQPEAYIANSQELFDANGMIKVEKTSTFIVKFMLSFESWIKRCGL
ncbi:NAD(P)H-dependent oxidoreductase [Xanthocytophaga agilis]|uniref:NAD(P)H-dependent oxidoreductase n=1 Tax=Xanthocytophaga agilis TaxID=3048010 RepID=A0AAE3RDG4_9BACT|nr:NAD(P)H-dependent oxidoreductase [Xanthocytophaga agilis]MDJ1506652.1 NAD(P)H-dependent oxidoreductase [Xanthocytophaga agilis]